jgi:small conductance mechanosensitive channel
MPAVPDLQLPNWAEAGLRIAGILVAAMAAIAGLQVLARVGTRQLLERIGPETAARVGSERELERRVMTLERLLIRVVAIAVVVIAVLTILGQFGIDVGPAVAGLGVVGIAVGLGAQFLIRDGLAGILIVLENQFSQGDTVRIAGVEGVVEDFSLRRTVLRDLDGTLHSVPNGQIVVASNLARLLTLTTREVALLPDADPERAAQLAREAVLGLVGDADWRPRLVEVPRIEAAPDPRGPSLRILASVRPADGSRVMGELERRVREALYEASLVAEPPSSHD